MEHNPHYCRGIYFNSHLLYNCNILGVNMNGSIRALVGFLMVFGAVGTMEVDPAASLVDLCLIAAAGLAIMGAGVSAMRKNT